MGTGRSGPFHSAAGGGVRGGSCTHPQSRPRPWPVSQRGCRQVAGAQDREAGFRVRSSRWRWLVPSHGCSSQRSRSPPLPSSARAVLAQRARSLRLACWCRSRTRRPTRGPVIRFSATGRLQPIEAPPGTAGRLPFTPKLNGSAQPRGWTVTPCAPRERKLM